LSSLAFRAESSWVSCTSSPSSSSQPTFLGRPCPAAAWRCRCGPGGPPSGTGRAPAGPAPLPGDLLASPRPGPRPPAGPRRPPGACHNHPGAILDSEKKDISYHLVAKHA
jgi:hypothetical protein